MAMDTTEPTPRPWARRISWLLLIWTGSVVSLGAITLLLRYSMAWAGLSR